MNNRVLVGLSGGVDSLVSTLKLKNMGYTPVGITFLFYGSFEDAYFQEWKQLSHKLNIEHHIIDVRKQFDEQILNYFAQEYLKGRTPFPCALCNLTLKWKLLNEYSEKLNCIKIATGHYAKIEKKRGELFISIHNDDDKDQSFFLWGLDQDILQKAIFPLADIPKTEVKEFALQQGFERISKQKESTGACFALNGDYRTFLKSYLSNPEVLDAPGNFVNDKGEVLGRHKGITNYTVGQRRGLGLNLNEPMFVSEIKVENNTVILSSFQQLLKTEIRIENYRLNDRYIDEETVYEIRVRYRNQHALGKLFKENDTILIKLLEPESAIAPGQTAVIYKNNSVLGGGFIV